MKYLSVCSGIEAASVAWHKLGWKPIGFSEIERFPSAVLKYRFPDVPNFGDMTKHEAWPIEPGSFDVLVGGTPCQSFSVAGLRKGISDPRGGLMLTYLEIARRFRPTYCIWENVPGVLSANGGRDFGAFLGALGQLGYGWAYRVLDAQWVRTQWTRRAVPQRRRRVFVVGCLLERCSGNWTRAGKILFNGEILHRNSRKGRAAEEKATADFESGAGFDCIGTQGVSFCGGEDGFTSVPPEVAGTLGARGFSCHTELDGNGAYIPFTKSKRAQSNTDNETWVDGVVNPTLSLFDQGDTRATTVAVSQEMRARRLTPRETERLQGFPDDWTRIPWNGKPIEQCPDGPRYKAIGNSMAVNCMEWLGERIQGVSK
jgi:DNA (cytosine-5)-methyltransferase 1